MVQNLLWLVAALSLVGPVWPTEPLFQSEALHQRCHGQSCKIAALSGSSGKKYHARTPPKDGTDAGDCCILSYNPSARKALYRQNPALRAECARKQLEFKRDEIDDNESLEVAERAACAKYTLIFAKGTDEIGPLGGSVGPALKQGLDQRQPGKWSVRGVIWNNDQSGNYCLGLPGGARAAKLLQRVARECPHTKIVMSGYSQGAMVVRNGIAYSHHGARKHVKAVVTFGDPFNGAPIKNYHGPINVFCARGDRVCDGRDIISGAHLSYTGMDTSEAVDYLIKSVG